MDKTKLIKIVSILLAVLALVVVVLVNFMPILNIQLDDVQSDYTFDAPGGHDILGWQCIFYWWGPSIFIGGVTACHFNIWLFLGLLLPVAALLICTPMLFRALYKKKAILEYVTAASMAFSAIVFLNATSLAELTVGNHLAQYMKMAKDQGTYTLGWWVYVLVAVLLVTVIIKILSGIYSLKYEKEAAAVQAAQRALEDAEDEDNNEE